ncbi:Sec-independent protein translocase subunit TatA/TatB [Salinivirga cyanobacteriivorans]|uniref:Sec-independent protein translocase protein TatA n=1 Tax=Salinivirga cyanobacteriivorans TaxID=1307839 RepID=A0A0S2I4P1_9BACT|nr:twin-arginine translocase TatA/TatE family subunit [Salinivirga cyanobacteriivorans]ALO17188.1 Sec-independent protein translocase protein TatAy [Salinivirga cyanobacteriivorans]
MNTLLTILLGIIGGPELIIIAIIILVLFGGRKIPELMRGLGKGVKEFKDASNETTETFKKEREDLENSVNDKSDKDKKS